VAGLLAEGYYLLRPKPKVIKAKLLCMNEVYLKKSMVEF